VFQLRASLPGVLLPRPTVRMLLQLIADDISPCRSRFVIWAIWPVPIAGAISPRPAASGCLIVAGIFHAREKLRSSSVPPSSEKYLSRLSVVQSSADWATLLAEYRNRSSGVTSASS